MTSVTNVERAGWSHRIDSEGNRVCQSVHCVTYGDGTRRFVYQDDRESQEEVDGLLAEWGF
jgi:hypothetical protein